MGKEPGAGLGVSLQTWGRTLPEGPNMVIVESYTTWQHFQARFAEWFSGIALFGFGSYLILHPGLFMDPRVAALWQGMAAMMAQQTWGLVGVLVGGARLSALYVNGRHTRTPAVRLVASFFSAFIWTQVVIGLWKADVPNTGLIIYPLMVVADIYSAFRASQDMTFVSHRERSVKAESRRVGNTQANS